MLVIEITCATQIELMTAMGYTRNSERAKRVRSAPLKRT